MRAERIVARARACVGARFRPQGRVPEFGLDCIGLVAFAIEAGEVRCDYALRAGRLEALEIELGRAGLIVVSGAQAGDVAVLRPGPMQLHLGIVTGAGLIHADAGLRRVVERPGLLPWPLLSIWRAAEQEEM